MDISTKHIDIFIIEAKERLEAAARANPWSYPYIFNLHYIVCSSVDIT